MMGMKKTTTIGTIFNKSLLVWGRGKRENVNPFTAEKPRTVSRVMEIQALTPFN